MWWHTRRNRFHLSAKRTSPLKSTGASFQSTTGSWGVWRVLATGSWGVWRVLATHTIRQFPLHFPSRLSPCAIMFQLDSNTTYRTHYSTPHIHLCIVLWTHLITPFYWHGYVVLSPCDCTGAENFHNINRWSPPSILLCGIFCAHMSLACGKINMPSGSLCTYLTVWLV